MKFLKARELCAKIGGRRGRMDLKRTACHFTRTEAETIRADRKQKRLIILCLKRERERERQRGKEKSKSKEEFRDFDRYQEVVLKWEQIQRVLV